MYGFQESPELRAFIGAELSQFCLGQNEVILNFIPDRIRITITSMKSFVRDNIEILHLLCGDDDRRALIFHKKIVDIAILEAKVLLIELSGGFTLRLTDDSEQYESVSIETGDNTIVV